MSGLQKELNERDERIADDERIARELQAQFDADVNVDVEAKRSSNNNNKRSNDDDDNDAVDDDNNNNNNNNIAL